LVVDAIALRSQSWKVKCKISIIVDRKRTKGGGTLIGRE